MKLIRKIAELAARQRVLLVAICCLCCAVFTRRAISSRRRRRLVRMMAVLGPRSVSIATIRWAVRTASNLVPISGIRCLEEALVAEGLLTVAGFHPELQFGVSHTKDDELTAHAWVTVDGHVVVGGSDYVPQYELLQPSGR